MTLPADAAVAAAGAGAVNVSTRSRRQSYERQQRRRATFIATSIDDRRRRPRGVADPQDVRVAEGAGDVLQLARLHPRLRQVAAPVLVRREDLPVLRAVHHRARPVDRHSPATSAPRRCSRCGSAATLYTDIVRGVPVILWITLLGFGVPGLLQTREWYGKLVIWGAVGVGHDVFGLRRRGVPRRHRERARVASARRRGRSACRPARRCGSSCSPRRCGGWCRR